MTDHEDEAKVEIIFRNGTLTVVGVILAFSLGFLSHWAGNPVPWQPYDAFALVPILSGLVFQILALLAMLDLDCLKRRVFERANRLFRAGLVLTGSGVALAVTFDYLEVSKVARFL